MRKRMMLSVAMACLMLINCGSPKARAADSESPYKPFSREVRAVLDGGDTFLLLSLNPSQQKKDDHRESFHGHTVLGKFEITNPDMKRELLNTLNAAVKKGCRQNMIAKCFNPRHGIKAISGTNEVNLLICFECRQIHIIRGNEDILTLVTADPLDLFNQTLREAGVPLVPQ